VDGKKLKLSIPIFVFFITLAITVSISYYFRYLINKTTVTTFHGITSSTKDIIDQEINNYRRCYYTAIPHLKNIYKVNNNTFEGITNMEGLFCNVKDIIIIDEINTTNPISVIKGDTNVVVEHFDNIKNTTRFKSILDDAFKNNNPEIFVTEYPEKEFHLSVLIPINKEEYRTYSFVNIGIENMLSTVEKADLLNKFIKVSLEITNGSETDVLYNSAGFNPNKETEISENSVKRHKEELNDKYIIQTNPDHIHLVFKEIRGIDMFRDIVTFPSIVNAAGTVVAFFGFIGIYYTSCRIKHKQ
jgi:hypothetical protein